MRGAQQKSKEKGLLRKPTLQGLASELDQEEMRTSQPGNREKGSWCVQAGAGPAGRDEAQLTGQQWRSWKGQGSPAAVPLDTVSQW